MGTAFSPLSCCRQAGAASLGQRVLARLREGSGGNGRREVGGLGRAEGSGALRVELPAGRSGAARRRRGGSFSGRTAGGAGT